MKALNRAIGRTVSQLARYGAEGCHPPMLMALENHLDALLTMERKQLETAGMKFATLTGDGTGEALPVINVTNTGCLNQAGGKAVAAHILRELERTQAPKYVSPLSRMFTNLFDEIWTPERVAQFNRMEPEQLIAGGRQPGKSEVNKLLRTPVEKWTSDQLAWFKANVLLSTSESERLEARWEAANMPAEPAQSAPVDASAEPCCGKYETCQKACVPRGIHIGRKQAQDEQAAQAVPETTPAPDVIDMTDPRNWQAGDVLLRSDRAFAYFEAGEECTVTYSGNTHIKVVGRAGVEVVYQHGLGEPASNFFTWLRHGDTA